MEHLLQFRAAGSIGRRALTAAAVAVFAIYGGAAVAQDTASRAAPSSAAPERSTIVGKALELNAQSGTFNTLLTAATCASLNGAVVNTLTDRGQRTLFAPTDAAFSALGLSPANVCSALPAAVLTQVLTYHVTNGRRDGTSVLDATQLRMLNGARVQQTGGVLTDGLGRQVKILATDFAADNGIIHVIDGVLLPPGFGS